ncbi:hypothetical protein [Cupriavidus pauculus]|uniref:hypothetical protein n=1 Tax=Cupriavidus pauculus TaxID=82633 RepID=UPI001FD0373C|nr:hypothetical protein [Cupriavidus pauculus]
MIESLSRRPRLTPRRAHFQSAAFAFVSGFSAHAHTSSSLGLLAGTLAVCALVARAATKRPDIPAMTAAAMV